MEQQKPLIEDVLEDDKILDYTQIMRRRYVDHATNGGVDMPQDPKEAKVLLAALSDMDRTVLSKKRIKSEEEAHRQSAQQIAELAAQVAKSIGVRTAPTDEATKGPPVLDTAGMDELQTVPGETSVGLEAETYESFDRRVSKKHTDTAQG